MAPRTPLEDRRQPLPDRVTMPLLTLVTQEAMDQDYVHAAERRAQRGEVEPPSRIGLRGAAVVTLAFGLMIALAAVQTARNADVNAAGRDALVDRINARDDVVSAAEDRVDELEQEIDDLETASSRVRSQLAAQNVDTLALEVSTGFVAVRGPGLRITVEDNPDGSSDGQVRASDLRRLVNGLWEAGAEAVAVNGRRLSALSPISQSGPAVTVNRSSLSPPYVVSAIGADSLGAELQVSTSGLQFDGLAQQFGFVVQRQNETELQLPSAPDSLLRLRFAEPATGQPDRGEELP